MTGLLRVCDGCNYDFDDLFTVVATDKLSYQKVADDDLADLLREGWAVTLHSHERITR